MTIRSIYHAEPLTAADRAWLVGPPPYPGRSVKAAWLLDGQPFPECEDPAELLARCAAFHGRLAIEAYSGNYAGLLTDELAGQDADRARLPSGTNPR